MTQRNRSRAHLPWLAALALAAACYGGQLPATPPIGLKINIVEGDGAINNITEGRARDPIVKVTDDDNKPIAGAAVTFLLPDLGAGGTFPTGASVTVTTGDDGVATARGLRPNNVAGQFQIRVTASYRSLVARASITQTNAAPASATIKKSNAKWIALIAIIGGGAAAGAALGLSGGSNSPGGGGTPPPATRPPTTVAPGGGVFGAP
jgi:hypothetical protein